jgi:hypothetical protein
VSCHWPLAVCPCESSDAGCQYETIVFLALQIPFYHPQGISIERTTAAKRKDMQIQNDILPVYNIMHIFQAYVRSFQYDDVSHHGENRAFSSLVLNVTIIYVKVKVQVKFSFIFL